MKLPERWDHESNVISTDEGVAGVWLAEEPDKWCVVVGRYDADGNPQLVAHAVVSTESDARIVADALAHHHLCEDCRNAVEH